MRSLLLLLAAAAAVALPAALAFLPPATPAPKAPKQALVAAAGASKAVSGGGSASRLFSSPMDGAGEFDEAARQAAQARIKELVTSNKVFLFMKGTKLFPQCGFSNTAVSILRAVDAEFETFDVLSDMLIREEIKKFSNWPTIPQCYIGGEFVGGSDILLEMFESGELEKMLEEGK